jgi:hypothetical protein
MSIGYIDTSQTFNGDGSSPVGATSDGGVGAFNNIQSYLDKSDIYDIGLLRRLNIGEEIPVTAALYFRFNGNITTPIKLIGYPFSISKQNIPITEVNSLSRLDGEKFQFTSTSTDLGDSSDYDHYWDGAKITIHQPGSLNDGLVRTCIYSQYDTDRMVIGLFPNLPEALSTSATFDITLTTEAYGEYSVPDWDNDTNSRPVIDANTSYVFGVGKAYCEIINMAIHITYTGDSLAISNGCSITNVVIYGDHLGYFDFNNNYSNTRDHIKDIFVSANLTSSHTCLATNNQIRFNIENFHVNKDYPNRNYAISTYSVNPNLINCSFFKVIGTPTGSFLTSGGPASGHNQNLELYGKITYGPTAQYGVYNISVLENSLINGVPYKYYASNLFYSLYSIDSTNSDWQNPLSNADFILKFIPSNLSYNESIIKVFKHPALLQANTSKTISLQIYPKNWSTPITGDKFWLEVRYIDKPTEFISKVVSSKDDSITFTNNQWNTISITIDPVEETQLAEVMCCSCIYESGAYILFDPGSGA